MRVAVFLLLVPVAALLSTAWLPFVNAPHVWLGMPSILTWSVGWVVALTPALGYVEYQRARVEGRSEHLRNGGGR
ncbi:hypothetical protein CG747_36745 [Streptomyces sp. CB02959]|uniref:hypothetical protein n=1 Tax=Streptomyces sp. CB02959 TaxID=2020330 RepID=UPI000C274C38|nr:hypothetical protein [Streptomyces sp. CB02959]PJN35870.1 hypothetical protein CG747_36745 [Streptomyces sp. CB02959]